MKEPRLDWILSQVDKAHLRLAREILEDASSLYDQREYLRMSRDKTWVDLERPEARLRDHVGALIAGASDTDDVCRARERQADPGELHAILRHAYRQDRIERAREILSSRSWKGPKHQRAIAYAFAFEPRRPGLEDVLAQLLDIDQLTSAAAHLAGLRRLGRACEDWLAERLTDNLAEVRVVWAAGRHAGRRPFREPLRRWARSTSVDPEVSYQAALALLRGGDTEVTSMLRTAQSTKAQVAMALGGGRAEVMRLTRTPGDVAPDLHRVQALALSGTADAYRRLIDLLGDARLSTEAAWGLYYIGGAPLFEETFVRERLRDDELFTSELLARRAGEHVQIPGEPPLGTRTVRLSRSARKWREFWDDHQVRFAASERHRLGLAHSPQALLQAMAAPWLPSHWRQLAYEEMVVRYGRDEGFDVELGVDEQRLCIAKYAAWIDAGTGVDEGGYTFRGRQL